MYILYSCIHMYMSTYMYILCSCMHTHGRMHVQCTYTLFTYRCSMDVSQLVTDRIGVLQHLYISTCMYMCVLCSCMHTHGLRHVQCTCTLFTCRCSMDVLQLYSNRQNWCPAAYVYIYMYLQVCTVQLYAHTWT